MESRAQVLAAPNGDPDTQGEDEIVSVVVVDEDSITRRLREDLEDAGLQPHFVSELSEAIDVVRRLEPRLLLVDGSWSGEDDESIEAIFAAAPDALRVLLLPTTTGAWVSVAHRCGADAILPAPLQRGVVGKLLGELGEIRQGDREPLELVELVDRSDRMRDVWRLVALASRGDASVLVSGETGAGKEAVARALHRFSPRRNGPFVAVNCAALPETLLESELFGHEKGAFTGATGQHKGRFEIADGGTLFLDEIGDLPLSLQVKLLRVLQERRFERIGGAKTISVDVRIISATHRDLEEEVRRGRFRADLYYRIRVLVIGVAPLHQRKEDILPLWDHFLRQGAQREGYDPPDTSMAARRRLLRHRWPGNVRELQNACLHALMLAGSRTIEPADLPETLLERDNSIAAASLVGMTLKEIEQVAILESYAALGTVKATADALGVSERKIHYRLKEYREDGSTSAKLRMAQVSGRAGPEGKDSEEAEGLPPRILLAEDDDELRWTLHDFLRCSGYRVSAVQDGHALLEHLGAAVLLEPGDGPPDAIITDVRMPFLTGLQILQKVRERGWSTPVVMISAFGDDELRRRATSLGAVAFLDKPIDTEGLLSVLREVIGR